MSAAAIQAWAALQARATTSEASRRADGLLWRSSRISAVCAARTPECEGGRRFSGTIRCTRRWTRPTWRACSAPIAPAGSDEPDTRVITTIVGSPASKWTGSGAIPEPASVTRASHSCSGSSLLVIWKTLTTRFESSSGANTWWDIPPANRVRPCGAGSALPAATAARALPRRSPKRTPHLVRPEEGVDRRAERRTSAATTALSSSAASDHPRAAEDAGGFYERMGYRGKCRRREKQLPPPGAVRSRLVARAATALEQLPTGIPVS